jgi:hypothetical protein
MRLSGDGKAEAVSASPNARDGARTTFQHADETHRFTLDSLKRAWTSCSRTLPSVRWRIRGRSRRRRRPSREWNRSRNRTMLYAQQIAEKGPAASRAVFLPSSGVEKHDLATESGLRAAIVEASGPYIAKWTAVDHDRRAIPSAGRRPLRTSSACGSTVRCRRRVLRSTLTLWRVSHVPASSPRNGAPITLGFDGSRYDDATALIATEVESGFQWPLGIWAHDGTPKWEVPVAEVDGAVSDAFERFNVLRMYCDPPKWESWVSDVGRSVRQRLAWRVVDESPQADGLRDPIVHRRDDSRRICHARRRSGVRVAHRERAPAVHEPRGREGRKALDSPQRERPRQPEARKIDGLACSVPQLRRSRYSLPDNDSPLGSAEVLKMRPHSSSPGFGDAGGGSGPRSRAAPRQSRSTSLASSASRDMASFNRSLTDARLARTS